MYINLICNMVVFTWALFPHNFHTSRHLSIIYYPYLKKKKVSYFLLLINFSTHLGPLGCNACGLGWEGPSVELISLHNNRTHLVAIARWAGKGHLGGSSLPQFQRRRKKKLKKNKNLRLLSLLLSHPPK